MRKTLFVALAVLAGTAFAEPRLIETKGTIQEMDDVINGIYLRMPDGVQLFEVPDNALVRQGLTRLSAGDLRIGDQVALRHWEDSDKVDRVEILQRGTPGTAVAQQPAPAASVPY